METFNSERTTRNSESDEESLGVGGSSSSQSSENTYHSLHHGAAGEFSLRKPGLLGGLIENSESKPQEPMAEQAVVRPTVVESEPAHRAVGYRAEQEQRYQGYTPGPSSTPTERLVAPTIPEQKNDAERKASEQQEAAARRAVAEAREAEAQAQKAAENHIEQDAWLRHVVDKDGHEVEGAVQYGSEYTKERAHELMGGDSGVLSPVSGVVGDDDNTVSVPQAQQQQSWHQPQDANVVTDANQTIYGHSSYAQLPPVTPQHQLPKGLDAGLAPSEHSLPAGMPRPVDWQHRLGAKSTKKQNMWIEALTSPWLFLMLSLILLAYFIATLI